MDTLFRKVFNKFLTKFFEPLGEGDIQLSFSDGVVLRDMYIKEEAVNEELEKSGVDLRVEEGRVGLIRVCYTALPGVVTMQISDVDIRIRPNALKTLGKTLTKTIAGMIVKDEPPPDYEYLDYYEDDYYGAAALPPYLNVEHNHKHLHNPFHHRHAAVPGHSSVSSVSKFRDYYPQRKSATSSFDRGPGIRRRRYCKHHHHLITSKQRRGDYSLEPPPSFDSADGGNPLIASSSTDYNTCPLCHSHSDVDYNTGPLGNHRVFAHRRSSRPASLEYNSSIPLSASHITRMGGGGGGGGLVTNDSQVPKKKTKHMSHFRSNTISGTSDTNHHRHHQMKSHHTEERVHTPSTYPPSSTVIIPPALPPVTQQTYASGGRGSPPGLIVHSATPTHVRHIAHSTSGTPPGGGEQPPASGGTATVVFAEQQPVSAPGGMAPSPLLTTSPLPPVPRVVYQRIVSRNADGEIIYKNTLVDEKATSVESSHGKDVHLGNVVKPESPSGSHFYSGGSSTQFSFSKQSDSLVINKSVETGEHQTPQNCILVRGSTSGMSPPIDTLLQQSQKSGAVPIIHSARQPPAWIPQSSEQKKPLAPDYSGLGRLSSSSHHPPNSSDVMYTSGASTQVPSIATHSRNASPVYYTPNVQLRHNVLKKDMAGFMGSQQPVPQLVPSKWDSPKEYVGSYWNRAALASLDSPSAYSERSLNAEHIQTQRRPPQFTEQMRKNIINHTLTNT